MNLECTDCWANAEGKLKSLRLNLEWGEIVELTAELSGSLTAKTVWDLTASLQYSADGNITLIPAIPIGGWQVR